MVRHFITLDFETYWSSKDYTLSKMGPISYVRDPRFHAQLLGLCIDSGPVTVFEHDDIPRVLASINPDDDGLVFVGHNINGFDALILSEIYGFRPKRILDTIVLMRWLGMSRVMRESHAAMTKALGNGVKEAGTVISDGKNWPDDFTPEEREAFKNYCANDVSQCRDNLYSLMNVIPEEVINFCSLTARMATEPQFVLDRSALEKYLAELDAATDKARQDLQALFQFNTNAELLKSLRSAKSFSTMLRQLGVEPPMKWSDKQEKEIPALSKTDTEFLDLQEHEDPRVRLLVSTRLEQNTSIHRSRTQTFINLSDKPLPILLSAFRAGTSRYTAGNGGSHDENKSDGTNLQNLSKRNPAYAALRKAVQAPKGYKVVACDSSQVEARLLAYVACQNDLLEIFRNGGDPYSVQASKFGSGLSAQDIHDGAKAHDKKCKMLRNIGKKCILSAGYGVGAAKFAHSLLVDGVKLSKNINKHNEQAAQYHAIYRDSNPMIVGYWRRCQEIVRALTLEASGTIGGPNDKMFSYGLEPIPGWDMSEPGFDMPSGYRVWYPNLRAEENEHGKLEYYYDSLQRGKPMPVRIYGSLMTENMIQGLAFQMLAWQACRMQDAGVVLAGNVHDSWFTIVPAAQADKTAELMQYWMSQVPPWLEGFPVACEVEIGDDYGVC